MARGVCVRLVPRHGLRQWVEGPGVALRRPARAVAFFNLGVEFGQLGFIALVLALGRVLQCTPIAAYRRAVRLPAYVVGIARRLLDHSGQQQVVGFVMTDTGGYR